MKRTAALQSTALVTIVSANYLPAARVLCRSFGEAHPGAQRFVVVVDRKASSAVRRHEPFEAIDVADLGIPDLEDMLAQYTILEGNTAIKPFAIRYLFAQHGLERVVYLDPDIWVHGPLDAVFGALDRASIVLTPHMFDPFRDDARPREIDILRSGSYNLGFIALGRGDASARLLDWWADKTEHDCVVDFENGLFVDQKWMDLVPSYFPETEILRHPGYNVAYWNLHERELTQSRNGRYLAASEPLAFFHFSGFDPDHPARLSKHQDRHVSRDNPTLVRLCKEYGDLVLAEGYEQAKNISYGFGALRNGIPVSPVVRQIVRHCRKNDIQFPSVQDAERFCRFLMTPNPAVTGRDVSPIAHFVLQIRKDVAAVYPSSQDTAEDSGFLHWMRNSAHEVSCRELHDRFSELLTRVNPFVRIKRLYEKRDDLRSEFPDALATVAGLERFANWLRHYGVREEGLDDADIDAFVDGGRVGFSKVLEYYLSSVEVASEFPLGLLPASNASFFDWMLKNGQRLAGVSVTDLHWFQHRALSVPQADLLLLSALRNPFLRAQSPLGATVLGWSDLCRAAASLGSTNSTIEGAFPVDPPPRVPGIVQLEILHAASTLHRTAPDAFRSRAALGQLASNLVGPLDTRLTMESRRRLLAPIATFTPAKGVNVAGHFHYAAGAGVAAHALVRALDAAGIAHQDVTLPVNPSRMCSTVDEGFVPEHFWTTHRPDFDVSITVANADAMGAARAFLGPCWDRNRTHVAHWVWETDRLPGRYAAAADGLDAIWTPSEFSARGLRVTLGDAVRVEVVPYPISIGSTADPRALPIALPEERTLFGFFFDARSVLERKNPKGLLKAFRSAFRKDDRVALVLKVNNGGAARKEMAELEKLADGLPVVWIRDVRLDEFQQRALLSRIDVHVSLHRSEGFGLVLAEAMALGKPVVATRYSGNLEFMDDSTAVLIDAPEIVTDRSHGPYPRGTRWADPNLEEAALALRAIHEDVERRRQIGERARTRIERLLSPRAVGERIARLIECGGAGPIPPEGLPQVQLVLARQAIRGGGGESVSSPLVDPTADAADDRLVANQPRSWPE